MACGSICLALTRPCVCSSWTNKLIPAKDHGSIQVNIGHLDEEGVYKTGQYTTFALHGTVRATVRTFDHSSRTISYSADAQMRSGPRWLRVRVTEQVHGGFVRHRLGHM